MDADGRTHRRNVLRSHDCDGVRSVRARKRRRGSNRDRAWRPPGFHERRATAGRGRDVDRHRPRRISRRDTRGDCRARRPAFSSQAFRRSSASAIDRIRALLADMARERGAAPILDVVARRVTQRRRGQWRRDDIHIDGAGRARGRSHRSGRCASGVECVARAVDGERGRRIARDDARRGANGSAGRPPAGPVPPRRPVHLRRRAQSRWRRRAGRDGGGRGSAGPGRCRAMRARRQGLAWRDGRAGPRRRHVRAHRRSDCSDESRLGSSRRRLLTRERVAGPRSRSRTSTVPSNVRRPPRAPCSSRVHSTLWGMPWRA